MKRTPLLLLCGMLWLCAACAAKKHLTADQYFNEANANFRSGALSLAIDQFHELLDQYPFSPHTEEAELRIAQAQYLSGNYPEAIVAFSDFQRRHPTSPNLPLVGYELGMCYAQQMGTVDRDQTAAQSAQAYFLTISQSYPDSPFAELAREQLARCRESLANHELYIAKFYVHRHNDKAAEIRLMTLAARYGDTSAAADALLRLANLYQGEHNPRDAALAYEALTRLQPHSAGASEARHALDRLAKAEPPNDVDPLDLLLAANGRHRSSSTATEIVQVPGLEAAHSAPGPAAPTMPAMGMGPAINPFGTGPYSNGPMGYPY
jgi:outer membrane protein assembly factor BamD